MLLLLVFFFVVYFTTKENKLTSSLSKCPANVITTKVPNHRVGKCEHLGHMQGSLIMPVTVCCCLHLSQKLYQHWQRVFDCMCPGSLRGPVWMKPGQLHKHPSLLPHNYHHCFLFPTTASLHWPLIKASQESKIQRKKPCRPRIAGSPDDDLTGYPKAWRP